MAFTQSHISNGAHPFKTFTATPSSGMSTSANGGKPVKEIVLLPDEEPVYCPSSSVSLYSEYELGLNAKQSVSVTSNTSNTSGQNNNAGSNVTSPQMHDIAPPPYHQYIAQQQQQRQMLQHQQQYPIVNARTITSPSDQVISNSYAEVVFHQRTGIRRTSDFSSSSTSSRNMRPPPSPQPRPPIPAHSPNSKLRNYSDSSYNGMNMSAQLPPPPPPHGRPLSGSMGPIKSSPSSSIPCSSVGPVFSTSVVPEMATANDLSTSAPQYYHQTQSQYPLPSSQHGNMQPQQPGSFVNPSMAFPISRSRVISRSNDNLNGPTNISTVNHVFEPPRLPPQSGVLHKTSGKVVLKPHAFKPVTPRSQSGSTSCHSSPVRQDGSPESPPVTSPVPNSGTSHMRPRSQTGRSQDGSSSLSSGTVPLVAATIHELRLSPENLVQTACPPAAFSNSNGAPNKPTRSSSALTSSNHTVSFNDGDSPVSPMSQSTSERETLRQRERELISLRRTMEQNEEAMMRVFEERRNELEKQLSLEQQCVAKLEAALQATTLQLRQTELRLSDCEAQLHARQIKATPPPLPTHSSGSRPPSMAAAPRRDASTQAMMDDSAEQIEALKRQLNAREAYFEEERNQWLEEKSKVISYQKQMQLNYVQLCSKTQRLESEVQQLTLDLERKDLHLANLTNGTDRI